MKIMKVGLIGYGYAGATFHAPIINSVPEMKLYAISSSQTDKVEQDWPDALVYATPEALLQDPDVDLIVIATPNQTHYPLAKMALFNGKHTVIDKPFTVTHQEAQALIDLAQAQNRLLSVYHNRRWDGDFLTLQKLINDNTLGRIVNIESRFDRFRPTPQVRWRESNEVGAGLLYDLSPHLIDQALVLMGMPQAIFAETAIQRENGQSIDFFQLIFYYEQCRISLSAGCLVKTPTPRFVVHGTQGSYTKYGIDPQEAMLKEGYTPLSPGWGSDVNSGFIQLDAGQEPHQEVENLPGCYEAYYHGIAHAIRHHIAPPVLAKDALTTIQLIELSVQSAQKKKIIFL